MQLLKFRNFLKPRAPILPNISTSTPIHKQFASFQDSSSGNGNGNSNPEVFVLGEGLPLEEKPQDTKLPFYLLFPIKSPLFPQSSYFTRLSTAQQELLTKMKVKYVTAFLTKDAVQKDPKSVSEDSEILHEEESGRSSAGGRSGRDPKQPAGKKDRYKRYREAQQASFFNPDMSSIIIYDENVSMNYGQELIQVEKDGKLEVKEHDEAFDIPKLNSIDDVYQLGTLCKLSIQKIPSENPEKKFESFAVLKSLSRVKLKEEVTDRDDIKGFITRPPKPPRKEKAKQNRGFSIFRPETFWNSQQEEEVDLNQVTNEVEKNEDGIFDSFRFVSVDHHETPWQIAEKDFTAAYQSNMSTLLDFYWKLRNRVQVNVPELPLLPEDPKALDLVCGFLSATSLFAKKDLQHLLQTIPLPQRLELCLKYIMKYDKEFNLQWDALEKQSSLPMDPNSAKQQFQDIYNFLKRSSENPFKKPIVEKLKENMANKKFPPEILKMIEEELSRFTELNESHPDYNIQRNFLELITALPFGVKSPDNFDIKHARKLLDEDHYGLDEVKNRILEFIAVAKLKGSIRGKSLLLVGPPGVGKTSIASSIARCLNRKYVRIALGGEHDVSVLKGHRKTYIGAYPGRLVQALKTSDTENPVILLDEIDKISSGMRGNLQDTLLEILDPVQNVKFTDHFLDTPIDLSNVLFVCTANLTETIHPAVLDRMEVIHLSGYTKDEKYQILKKYLLPRALEAAGLKDQYADKITITDEAIDALLLRYAREAGVRNLERLTKRICEKVTLKIVKGDTSEIVITPENLKDFVGLPKFSDQRLYKDIPPAGIIMGLAYNSYGGSTIYIETMKSNFDLRTEQKDQGAQIVTEENPVKKNARRGNIKITGSLGDVMQESTQIAYSYAKYILSTFFNSSFLETNDVHIHFPDGASKKDGPSAGVAITSSLISLALDTPTADVVAMTGEISLTGKVLKIGGVKEKVLAAKRENVKKVILPLDNKEDVDELKDYIKEGLEFEFADSYMQVMKILFPSLVKDKPGFAHIEMPIKNETPSA